MNVYGLLGYPLGHSFSQNYFREKFQKEKIYNCEYRNFAFDNIVKSAGYLKNLPGLAGFNVTIPYKKSVIPFLSRSSAIVEKIKSCNCVKVVDGKWSGFNTDVIGFEKSLVPLLNPWHTKALVFGTGGASGAVGFVLDKLGLQYLSVSRKKNPGQMSYSDLTPGLLKEYSVLINTTPVGMYPNNEEFLPIPYDGISSKHLVYDLIYNPEETLFMRKAKLHGAVTKNGYEMLLIQAEESWKIWNEG